MIWLFLLLLQASALEPLIQQSSRPMSENMAAKVIKNKSILLKLALRKCKDERLTASRLKKDEESIYWFSELPADSKFDYDSCKADAPYMSQYLLLYCKKSKRLHEIRHFFPAAKFVPSKKPLHNCNSLVRI